MEPKEKETKSRMSLVQYFSREITHGYFLDENDSRYTERRQRVYTFLKQPIEIEKMMTYGFLLCFDVFLYMFTFLPLRIFLALLKFVGAAFCCIRRQRTAFLDPAQKCDLLKALIFIVTVYLMSYIDTSFIYHLVRAQTLIKLYIIYNMLEVADRLFSSFGQDILDALFWTAIESGRDSIFRVLLHIVLAIIYVFFHCILVLFEATTINCAFNSHNKVLLTVMMANNFVEIKGTVFKKYDKNNLFQISCSDVRERFHYCALLFIVLLRNMQQYSWSSEHFIEIMPHMATVIFSECLVDWFKHAFVLKFNHIPIESYTEYRTTLAYDLISSRQKDAISDHCDVVSRRMGFIPLPLAVLIFHIVRISVDFNGYMGSVVIAVGLLILVLVKILNSIILMGKASQYIDEDLASARKSESEMSIVDPFEQRGGKTILIERSLKKKPTASVSATTSGTIYKKRPMPCVLEHSFVDNVGTATVRPMIQRTPNKDPNKAVFDLGDGPAQEYTLRRRRKNPESGKGENDENVAVSSMAAEMVPDEASATVHRVMTSGPITTPAKERSMRPPSIDLTMISSAASLTNLNSLDEENNSQGSSTKETSSTPSPNGGTQSSLSSHSSLNSDEEAILEEHLSPACSPDNTELGSS